MVMSYSHDKLMFKGFTIGILACLFSITSCQKHLEASCHKHWHRIDFMSSLLVNQ